MGPSHTATMSRPHWPKGRNKDAPKRERAEKYDEQVSTSLSFEEIIGKLANTPPPKEEVKSTTKSNAKAKTKRHV